MNEIKSEWEKAKKMNKKAAVELSVGTIVIIVLAMTMLILGLVLVRSIMCGAISLTSEVNKNIRSEINKLFESTQGEVVCLGSGDKPVTLIPGGEADIIYCAIKAPETARYSIVVKPESIRGSISQDKVKSWIIGVGIQKWEGTISPGDESPKKLVRLNVPENAPEEQVRMQVEITRDGELISTQDLDFTVKRTGLIRSAVC